MNKNDKKAIGLDWQNNNFARASRFFVHFFAVAARPRRELPNFTFFDHLNIRRQISLTLFKLGYFSYEINSRRVHRLQSHFLSHFLPPCLIITRNLTIWQQRRQWKRCSKIDFASFETFLPLYKVTLLLESREVSLELKRGTACEFSRRDSTIYRLAVPVLKSTQNLVISRCSCAGTEKKCKKARWTCRVVVLLIKLTAFLTFPAHKNFRCPGEHGFSFFQVKMLTGSASVLLTSASLKIKKVLTICQLSIQIYFFRKWRGPNTKEQLT